MQYSQPNLVPNGSFEDTVSCPTFSGQINKAKYWYNPNSFSPDYYNQCSSNFGASVPSNGAGFQLPKYGNGYVGIFIWYPMSNAPAQSLREYIQTNLTDSLSGGTQYCVKIYVNLSDKFKYTTSKVECYFNSIQDTDFSGNYSPLAYIPQLTNQIGNYITDTINWTELNWVYTPLGGEKWMTIGNFNDYSSSDSLLVDSNKFAIGSYFFIDDVSVVAISPANAGNDTTYCTQDTATIGGLATFAADYVWSKISGNAVIDSVNSANPHVWASSSGTSTFVMQKTQCSVITYDTVSISFSCVGISENQQPRTTCTTFPNPFSNSLTFSLSKSSDYTLLIFDISGKQLQKKTFSGSKYELENFNAESGIYHYCIEDAKGEKLRGKLLKL